MTKAPARQRGVYPQIPRAGADRRAGTTWPRGVNTGGAADSLVPELFATWALEPDVCPAPQMTRSTTAPKPPNRSGRKWTRHNGRTTTSMAIPMTASCLILGDPGFATNRSHIALGGLETLNKTGLDGSAPTLRNS
jgi:hypothetical protein